MQTYPFLVMLTFKLRELTLVEIFNSLCNMNLYVSSSVCKINAINQEDSCLLPVPIEIFLQYPGPWQYPPTR